MVIGHIKPIILLPMAIVNQLSIKEVEAILVHELAHVRRYDYLLNMLQALVELFCYYHPALHWLNAQIRQDREYCADEITVAHGIPAVDYAKLLLRLQTITQPSQLTFAMKMITKSKSLLQRVENILIPSATKKPHRNYQWLWSFGALVALIAMVYNPTVDMHHKEAIHVEKLQTQLPMAVHSLDTIPTRKKIIVQKQITIENGDTTITETTKEIDGDGEGSAFFFDMDEMEDVEQDISIRIEKENGVMVINGDTIKFPEGMGRVFSFEHMDSFPHQIMRGRVMPFMNGEEDFDFDFFSIDSLSKGMAFQWFEDGHMDSIFSNLKGRLHHFDIDVDSLYDHIKMFEFDTEDFDFPQWHGQGGHRRMQMHRAKLSPADQLQSALLKDQLIPNDRQSKVELSHKHLKIDGEKQPSNIHRKYLEIWENATGIAMNKGDQISLLIHPEKKKIKEMKRF